MRKIRNSVLVAAAVTVAGTGVAMAQTAGYQPFPTQAREYQAQGARVGSFVLFPSLSAGVEYNDNTFLRQANEQSDVIARVSPRIAARSDFSRHQLVLNAGTEAAFHSNSSDDNTIDYNVGMNAVLEATRDLKIKPKASYRHSHEARGDDNVNGFSEEPVPFDTVSAGVDVEYLVGRMTINLLGDVAYRDFEDVALFGGGIDNQDDRDRVSLSGGLRVGYEFRAGTQIFAEGRYMTTDFDNVDDNFLVKRDSDEYRILAGVKYSPSAVRTVSLGAGYVSRSFDQAVFSDVDGFAVNGSLAWAVTPLTRVYGSVERRVDESSQNNAAAELVWSSNLSVRHELRRNVILGAKVSYANRLFEGNASTRDDDVFGAGVQADYYLTKNFSIGAKYDFARRVSTDANAGYTQNKVIATAVARF